MKPHAYVILGLRHGSEVIEQVGELIDASKSREAFIPFRETNAHPEFETVWLCRLEIERTVRLTEAVTSKTPSTNTPQSPTENPAPVSSAEQAPASDKRRGRK